MSLIKCPECGNEVSDKAKACPKCGYPVEELYKPTYASSVANLAKNEIKQATAERIALHNSNSGIKKFVLNRDRKNFRKEVIPNGVTHIADYEYSSCIDLERIEIPDSVASIGDGAFGCCKSLKTVTLPDSITNIGSFAFSSCISLTTISIPKGITHIANHVFNSCISLMNVTIPSSVTSIDDFAFFECRHLSRIIIPESVTFIGANAFAGCESLMHVTLPESVTFIGASAFAGCESLIDVTLPRSVERIAERAFGGCNHLTIHAYQGSYAERYAKYNNIPYSLIINQQVKSEFYMKVAGVSFEGRQRIVSRLKIGQELVFIPDPSNPYDNHAVKICTTNGEQIGFIAREYNNQIFNNLINGHGTYRVSVSNITGGGIGENYGCNIRVCFFEKDVPKTDVFNFCDCDTGAYRAIRDIDADYELGYNYEDYDIETDSGPDSLEDSYYDYHCFD